MRTALQTRRPHGTEKRQAPTTAEAARSPIHRARDQVLSKSTLVRHEAVDSVSRRRSHQERSVSSRPRVVAFEEAALEWPTTDRTLDASRLPSRRGGAGGGQQTSRFGQTIVSDDSGLSATPIDAAMGSARSDLDAPGSRQPAVALDAGQHHMVHLYFPRVPVMVCTTTGTLVPRTSPAPCARHPRAPGWLGTPRSRSSASSSPYRAANYMLEYVPAHAPELNAVEYIRGCWERHGPPCTHNFGPTRS
jgi:hypothetical protein